MQIREICFLYCHSVNMNKNFNKSTCTVCFEVKGKHSKTPHNKITKGIKEKIATYIWPAYNLGISVCPSVGEIFSVWRRDQPNGEGIKMDGKSIKGIYYKVLLNIHSIRSIDHSYVKNLKF